MALSPLPIDSNHPIVQQCLTVLRQPPFKGIDDGKVKEISNELKEKTEVVASVIARFALLFFPVEFPFAMKGEVEVLYAKFALLFANDPNCDFYGDYVDGFSDGTARVSIQSQLKREALLADDFVFSFPWGFQEKTHAYSIPSHVGAAKKLFEIIDGEESEERLEERPDLHRFLLKAWALPNMEWAYVLKRYRLTSTEAEEKVDTFFSNWSFSPFFNRMCVENLDQKTISFQEFVIEMTVEAFEEIVGFEFAFEDRAALKTLLRAEELRQQLVFVLGFPDGLEQIDQELHPWFLGARRLKALEERFDLGEERPELYSIARASEVDIEIDPIEGGQKLSTVGAFEFCELWKPVVGKEKWEAFAFAIFIESANCSSEKRDLLRDHLLMGADWRYCSARLSQVLRMISRDDLGFEDLRPSLDRLNDYLQEIRVRGKSSRLFDLMQQEVSQELIDRSIPTGCAWRADDAIEHLQEKIAQQRRIGGD